MFIILLIFNIFKNTKTRNQISNKYLDTNFEKYDISGRIEIVSDRSLLIGKNIKELENGYFDVKIERNQDGFIIYINKLVKSDISDSFIDKDYLIEVNNIIYDITGVDSLIELIKNKFLCLRENKNLDDASMAEISEKFSIKDNKVRFDCEDNMLVIKIKKGE